MLAANTPAAQHVEADVGGDTVKPGVKSALEPKTVEAAVGPQEGFLIRVPGVVFGPQQIHGHAQDISVVQPDELLEGIVVPLLRGPDQSGLADRSRLRAAGRTKSLHRRCLQIV